MTPKASLIVPRIQDFRASTPLMLEARVTVNHFKKLTWPMDSRWCRWTLDRILANIAIIVTTNFSTHFLRLTQLRFQEQSFSTWCRWLDWDVGGQCPKLPPSPVYCTRKRHTGLKLMMLALTTTTLLILTLVALTTYRLFLLASFTIPSD